MNRLQLATLLSWADESGLQGRKRLQKVVFFLQQAGCPLDCRYTLLHFGPYSRDVADICDEMVAAGLIEEKVNRTAWGLQYEYSLKADTKDFLAQAEDQSMESFQGLGKDLIQNDIWQLELGSTILFFYEQLKDWDQALSRACNYKDVQCDDEKSKDALKLAQKVKEPSGN